MNKEWSELNKTMQTQIRKKDTYEVGIDTLFELRNHLMKTLTLLYEELNREEFNAIPFISADGYHSKTIAYSIWHVFRIEDIVAHTLINADKQVYFVGAEYRNKGYASEAVKAYVCYFFEHYDEIEIIATIREDNIPSWKTIEKVGFVLRDKRMYKDINDIDEKLYRFYSVQRK